MRKPSLQNAKIFTIKVVFLFMFMKKITLGKSYTLYNFAPYTEITQVSLMEQPPNIKLAIPAYFPTLFSTCLCSNECRQ